MVYLPRAELLYTFPFINDASAAGAGNDPMQVLNNMIVPKGSDPAYVSAKEGACWFCAVGILVIIVAAVLIPY
jgi:hypothetical protein